jgi:hypothetical protein
MKKNLFLETFEVQLGDSLKAAVIVDTYKTKFSSLTSNTNHT